MKVASRCSVCLGKYGLATNSEAPDLERGSAIYIEKQLVAFKSGERQHRQMSLVTQGLELGTTRNLAVWHQAMKVTVELSSLP